MCFAFFQGKGYSGEFTENMRAMKEKLEENPEVILVCGADDVCARCPNNHNGKCVGSSTPLLSEDNTTPLSCKADYYDQQVLTYCGLTAGSKIRWNDFAAAVKTCILTPGNREKICGDCEWNSLCR